MKTSKNSKSTLIVSFIIIIVAIVLWGWYLWHSAHNTKLVEQTNKQNIASTILNIGTDNATLGNYLIASNSMTLYYFTKDTSGVSNCYDACANSWKPYIISSTDSIEIGQGIMGNISTIVRTDGTMQLTYNGAPLYFWSKDIKPGDTNGQNIGSVWFVVKP